MRASLRIASFLAVLALVCIFTKSPHAADNEKPAAAPAKPATPKQPKRKPNPVFAEIEDNPALPRILLLGDSISIGYTLPVRKQLEGKANVHRALTNCGPTTNGVKNIDKWLGDGKWDVIHFNFGLHDLKYIGEKGALVAVADGKQQVSSEDYEKNLRTLVERMKQTGAKLIFASTTPVPEGAKGRIVGDSAKYNEIAIKVMTENEIAIDDLYTFAHERDDIQKKADVHFTPSGSEALATEVVKSIESALK